MTLLPRLLIAVAALYGAAGVALAAVAAHAPDAARLAPASTMLLLHAGAIIAAVLLADRGLTAPSIGRAAAIGFAAGAALFAGDLSLRQFAGRGLFPMAAPSGGALLIGSWLLLALAALRPRR